MARFRSFTTAVCTAALIAGGALVATVPGATSAGADTITVTNTADDGSDTSLRYLLQTAGTGDVFELVPGATYTLDRCADDSDAGAQFILSDGEILVFEAVTINGNGATIEQTCPSWRVLHTEADLTLNDVTITGGTSTRGGGGGIRVDASREGPFALGESAPTLVLVNVSLVDNCTTGSGGGLKMNTAGSVIIENSTIANNAADDNGGGLSHSHEGDVTLVNSTVSGNSARNGGGVEVRNGYFNTVYSDIVNNAITDGTNCGVADTDVAVDAEDPIPSAVVYPANVSTFAMRAFGTVIALPVNGLNCSAAGTQSLGYNYADDLSCIFFEPTDNQNEANDPLLGALGANGGPTLTHLPLTGSPLINAIPTAACSDGDEVAGSVITTDQRLLVRPDIVNQKCDIGSVEVQTEPPVEIQPNFTG